MPIRQNTIIWDRLVAPPRKVPHPVQARVRFTEIKRAINLGSGFLGLWFSGAGAMLIIFGLVWLNVVTAIVVPQIQAENVFIAVCS